MNKDSIYNSNTDCETLENLYDFDAQTTNIGYRGTELAMLQTEIGKYGDVCFYFFWYCIFENVRPFSASGFTP